MGRHVDDRHGRGPPRAPHHQTENALFAGVHPVAAHDDAASARIVHPQELILGLQKPARRIHGGSRQG